MSTTTTAVPVRRSAVVDRIEALPRLPSDSDQEDQRVVVLGRRQCLRRPGDLPGRANTVEQMIAETLRASASRSAMQ